MAGTDQTPEDERQVAGKVREPDELQPADYIRYAYRLVLISVFVVAGIFLLAYGPYMIWWGQVPSDLHAPMSSVVA